MLKKLTPHIIAVVIFLLLTCVYMMPLFNGKSLAQQDIAQWTGMSKEIVDFRSTYHTEPLWTGSMFSGMPAYQVSTLYPANLIEYVSDLLFFFLPSPASYIFCAFVAFYLLLIALRIDYRLSIAGAVAFALSSYNMVILIAGHNSKAHAIALMPLVIAGILLTLQKRFLFGGAITALGLAMELYANHLQITYYLALCILVLIVAFFVQSILNKTIADFFKSAAVLAAATIIAILPNITSLMVTEEYGKYSTRSQSELTEKKSSTGLDKDYAFSYSYGISETFTLLIPKFHGGASVSDVGENSATYKALMQNNVPRQQAKEFVESTPLYWGNMISTAGPPYVGAIICFLFVLGLFIVNGAEKWWLAGATLLSFLLAWGEYALWFNDFMFYHFPAYNKFRAVSMALTISQFTMPLLAILAAHKIFSGKQDFNGYKKTLLYSLYITGGFCLLFSLIPGFAGDFIGKADKQLEQYDWLLSAIREDRSNALRMDAFRSLFFIGIAFSAAWFYLKGKVKQKYVLIGLIVFITIDLWTVGKRYLNNDSFVEKSRTEKPFPKTAADEQILADKSLSYRVMNFTLNAFSDASTSYWHKSIGGYHGAKLKRYQELIEYQISKNNQDVLNMLNTKYFIVPDNNKQPVAQLNPVACGNAWFIEEIKMVADADTELKSLDKFNPNQTVFIDKRFEDYLKGFNPQYDSTATISLTDYKANHLTYQSNVSSEQFAVLSEIYYPKGWNAYIDGKPVEHIRVNYVLRGIRIPAGTHKIEFKFEPATYYTGEKIALASSATLILIFVGVMVMEIRKNLKA